MKTSRDFSRKQIHAIAEKYACYGMEYSHKYFSREYKITEKTFYNLLEKAVIEGIVSDSTVEKMKQKAMSNAYKAAGENARIRSSKHYNYLICKRKEYRLNKKKTIELVTKYANLPLRKDEFAKENFITISLLNRTIRESIVQNLVSDKIVEKLKEKSLNKFQGKELEKVQRFWKKILEERKNNANSH